MERLPSSRPRSPMPAQAVDWARGRRARQEVGGSSRRPTGTAGRLVPAGPRNLHFGQLSARSPTKEVDQRQLVPGPVVPVVQLRTVVRRLSLNERPVPELRERLRSSSSVFITIGPYHATGSSSGLPDTSRNRMPLSPACTVTSSPRSKSTSDRLPVVSSTGRSSAHRSCPSSHLAAPTRRGTSPAGEDVGKRVTRRLDRQRAPLARRHRDVE